MQQILDAILAGDACRRGLRRSRAARVLPRGRPCTKDEVEMFEGLASRDKDPRKSPARRGRGAARARPGRGAGRGDGQRDQLQHRLDLDLRAGLDLRVPGALRPALPARPSATTCPTTWSAPTWPASCCAPARACNLEARRRGRRALPVGGAGAPDGHNDTMLDPEQRIWGFETNFGGLAEIALVKANQLMPKPAHLTWEEAASPGLVNSTAYRQLVSRTAPA